VNDRTIILRTSTLEDGRAIDRLAEIDSADAPAGELLLAEVDGVLLAGISVSDGSVIANPFKPTLEFVALLRHRRDQLMLERRTSHAAAPVRSLRHRRVALAAAA
jgi:hypothetical protein